jgi:hypothetical protein
LSHTTVIVTKPPPGFAPAEGTVVHVTYHPSDDPVVAARQAEKIDKLTARIIKVGDRGLDDGE